MATTVDPAVFRPHQDELLPGGRVSPAPVPFTAGSYYTPAPVGPSPKWPKHPSFYPLDKPRRQPKPPPAGRDTSKPVLRTRPQPKTAPAKLPGKAARVVRRAPTSSSEELDLPSTPSPRATSANDVFSDSTSGSRDSNNDTSSSPGPAPASPRNPAKPVLRNPPSTVLTASGSSSFTSLTSRRLSLDGGPSSANNILFPHQSFSTIYSSRSHDSYLHSSAASNTSTAAASTTSSRLPKRVSFADNLEEEAPHDPTACPTADAAPGTHATSPPASSKPLLHTSLRACRHPTCTACNARAASGASPAGTTRDADAAGVCQLESVCSTSSSLTDPNCTSEALPRGPPTPPLEEEEAAYENPTFTDSEEVFHTPREALMEAPEAPRPDTRQQRPAADTGPESPVLPLPIRSPSLSLNPLHHASAMAPMPPHSVLVALDSAVPQQHSTLLSGPFTEAEIMPAAISTTPAEPSQALTDPAPTPVTGPATPVEPSTPRALTFASPQPSPRRSPIRSLQARLAALATAPVSSAPSQPLSPSTPTAVVPTAHSVDAAAPKPTLSLRARLQMPSTFLRSHSGLFTAPAASFTKPAGPPRPSSRATALKSLAENGYERQKNGWGLLMWDSSAAVTRKLSAAQNSLFGFEAAMLAEVEARKAREAEEAYKVGPSHSIIGSCGGWREPEATRGTAPSKGADGVPISSEATVPIQVPSSSNGFVQADGGAEPVASFGCFIPFIRSKKAAKERAIR